MKKLEQTTNNVVAPIAVSRDSESEPGFRELSARGKRRAAMWGTGFILVGIPSMPLPVLQGGLLILVGLVLLSLSSKRIHQYMVSLQDRFPRLRPAFVKAEEKAIEWFGLE